jgi:hypothetical protein
MDRATLEHAIVNYDDHDQFAWVQEWRFAICDRLVWDMGESVKDFKSYGPDDDSYALAYLRDMNDSAEELHYALKILDRYRVWLRLAEKDY